MRSGARPRSAPDSLARWGPDGSAPATSSYCPSMRAHSRCTPPMNAPRPPPTMPSRSGRAAAESWPASTMSGDAEHPAIRGEIGAGAGEHVERLLRNLFHLVDEDLLPLECAFLRMSVAARPLGYRQF